MGLSYSPVQNGAFALLLSVEGDSPVRIPVVIGAPEAQSIAINIEGVRSPRPMTHDLFCSFAHAFGLTLEEVFIYKFEDGIYSAEMTFTDGDRTVVLDSRTSDAVAVAMRTGAPIFTTPAIVDECGIILHEKEADDVSADADEDAEEEDDEIVEEDEKNLADELAGVDADDDDMAETDEYALDLESLERRMEAFARHDDYESAMRVKKIIDSRKAAQSGSRGDDNGDSLSENAGGNQPDETK